MSKGCNIAYGPILTPLQVPAFEAFAEEFGQGKAEGLTVNEARRLDVDLTLGDGFPEWQTGDGDVTGIKAYFSGLDVHGTRTQRFHQVQAVQQEERCGVQRTPRP